MKMTQMSPVHAANLVANSYNTVYRVEVFSELKYLDALKMDSLPLQEKVKGVLTENTLHGSI